MWTRKNKTRLWEWDFTIQKPMANNVVMRNWLFVSLKDWYIIPADGTTEIEGCAINDRYSGENNEHRYCIYQPKRNWETFTMEVDNWTITQADVGKTFRIADSNLQHINYPTKADRGWQFRLEEVLNENLWTFTYCFDIQFAPQWPQGNDGDTPSLEMGTVTKLQPDENPTAELVPDPNNPNKYTLNLWLPSWATWPKGQKGDTGEKGNTWAAWAPWQDGENGTDWTNGTNWVSPHREWDWNWGTTYTYLAMVRYPDQNNEYWTWIWNSPEPTSGSTPGVDGRRGKMNKDWEPGPQGEEGWTIVIPVEWKPGKDWIWVDGKDWDPWISPHNEWIWSPTKNYSELAMVRAWTWEYNAFGDEIRWYYITQNWAYGNAPKDWNPRQLVVKDWNWIASVKEYVDDMNGQQDTDSENFKKMCMILFKYDNESLNWHFKSWNMDIFPVYFDWFVWDRDVIDISREWIAIPMDWTYRVTWHTILKCNQYYTPWINLARMSVYKNWNIPLWTSKAWWPYLSSQANSWLWIDLHTDFIITLKKDDEITMKVRCQTDATWVSDSDMWHFVVIWAWDTSGETSESWDLKWAFATYLSIQLVNHQIVDKGAI